MYSKVAIPSLLLLSVNGAAALSYKRELAFAAAKRDDAYLQQLRQQAQSLAFQGASADSDWSSFTANNPVPTAPPVNSADWSSFTVNNPLPTPPSKRQATVDDLLTSLMQAAQGAVQQVQASPQPGSYNSAVIPAYSQPTPTGYAQAPPAAYAQAPPAAYSQAPPAAYSQGVYSQTVPAQGSISDLEDEVEALFSALSVAYMSPVATGVASPPSPVPSSPVSSPVSSSLAPSASPPSQRRRSVGGAGRVGLRPYKLPVRRQVADGVFSDLSNVGDDIASAIESLIGGLPTGIVPVASALFADATGVVAGGFDSLESAVVGSASAISTSATPTASPSASTAAARRQVAASASASLDPNTIFSDVDAVGDDLYSVLSAILAGLPSNIQPEASSLLVEATGVVGGAFSSISAQVESGIATASPVASSAGALAARATTSKNAAAGSRASLSSATFMGMATVVGSLFVGALTVL